MHSWRPHEFPYEIGGFIVVAAAFSNVPFRFLESTLIRSLLLSLFIFPLKEQLIN
jgi:hypothetical protein